MKITPERVQSVATLARLAVSNAEVQVLADQLTELVEYFEQLNELDTDEVEPTSHAVPMACPQREDAAQPSDRREGILAQGPRTQQEHFVVPKVID